MKEKVSPFSLYYSSRVARTPWFIARYGANVHRQAITKGGFGNIKLIEAKGYLS